MSERHMVCITMQREVGNGLAGGSKCLSSGHHQMLMKDSVRYQQSLEREREVSEKPPGSRLQKSPKASVCREVIKRIYRATDNQ